MMFAARFLIVPLGAIAALGSLATTQPTTRQSNAAPYVGEAVECATVASSQSVCVIKDDRR